MYSMVSAEAQRAFAERFLATAKDAAKTGEAGLTTFTETLIRLRARKRSASAEEAIPRPGTTKGYETL